METVFTPFTSFGGGLLIGLGASLGSGCTSGDGVCGPARLPARSLLAVPTFMATAAITVFVIRRAVAKSTRPGRERAQHHALAREE